MREIAQTKQYKSDIKKIARSGRHRPEELGVVIASLAKGEALPTKYRDHALSGDWRHYRECHIRPDWLLIYKTESERLTLARTGSHSDLF